MEMKYLWKQLESDNIQPTTAVWSKMWDRETRSEKAAHQKDSILDLGRFDMEMVHDGSILFFAI